MSELTEAYERIMLAQSQHEQAPPRDIALLWSTIEYLQTQITNLRRTYSDVLNWADEVGNLYLCHQCQPELDACGTGGKDEEE